MTDYIERDRIIKALNHATDDPACPLHIAAEVYQIATECPAADVQLVKRGTWCETKKHLWYKNKDGTPDIFAYSSRFCNGVECIKCGKYVCIHCHPNWENEDSECNDIHYVCSCCGYETMEKTAYCPKCGADMGRKEG